MNIILMIRNSSFSDFASCIFNLSQLCINLQLKISFHYDFEVTIFFSLIYFPSNQLKISITNKLQKQFQISDSKRRCPFINYASFTPFLVSYNYLPVGKGLVITIALLFCSVKRRMSRYCLSYSVIDFSSHIKILLEFYVAICK